MIILASVHWRKINGINFFMLWNVYKCVYCKWKLKIWLNHFKQTLKFDEHHCTILMQSLIISSLKSVSRYVSWGECIVAALTARWSENRRSLRKNTWPPTSRATDNFSGNWVFHSINLINWVKFDFQFLIWVMSHKRIKFIGWKS